MCEMTLICVRCIKYVRNKVHMFEIAMLVMAELSEEWR